MFSFSYAFSDYRKIRICSLRQICLRHTLCATNQRTIKSKSDSLQFLIPQNNLVLAMGLGIVQCLISMLDEVYTLHGGIPYRDT